MIDEEIKDSIRDMESTLMRGRGLILTAVPHHGEVSEAARRYNVMVVLHCIRGGETPSAEQYHHVMFEDEEIDAEDLDEVMVAVHLERAVWGVYQIALGNRWGNHVANVELQELDGKAINLYAAAIADGVKGVLLAGEKQGSPSAPSEE